MILLAAGIFVLAGVAWLERRERSELKRRHRRRVLAWRTARDYSLYLSSQASGTDPIADSKEETA